MSLQTSAFILLQAASRQPTQEEMDTLNEPQEYEK